MSRSARQHVRQRAAGIASSYDAAVLAAGPVAYWSLGGGSAGVADKTGRGHTGTYHGDPVITSFLDGSNATVFNGSSQYAEFPDAPDLSVPASGILTIEAWMRPDALQFPNQEGSGYVHWMGKGELGQQEYLARMYSLTNSENRPNRISGYSFNLAGGLGAGSYVQDSVSVGDWIHYVLIINTVNVDAQYTTGYTRLYKNGEPRDKDALSGYAVFPGNGTAPFRVGTRDFLSFFQGAVSKVAMYDYELSTATIRSHYQAIVPPAAGSVRFIKHIGHAISKTAGTTLAITVPAGGVSAGNTLLVKVAHEYTAGGPTVIDSKGNTYTRDQTSPNSGTTMRASLFSAPINAELNEGDTILLTLSSSVSAKAISIDEFSGLIFSTPVDQKNNTSGNTTTPGGSIPITTTQADELLTGLVAVNGPVEEPYTEDDTVGQWTGLTRSGTTGGSANSNMTLNSAYRVVGATGTYRYQPVLGVAEPWIEIIASYKAGTPVITPPVHGTAIFIQNVGTVSSKASGTTLTMTVPFGGIQAGHTIITRVASDYTAAGPTMSDARGNNYVRDRTAANAGTTIRSSIFSCIVTVPLLEGDSITVTFPVSVTARAVAADEFANVLSPITIDTQNGLTGNSTSPSLPVTTSQANCLLIGMLGSENDNTEMYTEDVAHQWTSLARGGTTGSTSDSNMTISGAYRAVGSTGTYTYAPTIGVSANWIAFLMAYRAT